MLGCGQTEYLSPRLSSKAVAFSEDSCIGISHGWTCTEGRVIQKWGGVSEERHQRQKLCSPVLDAVWEDLRGPEAEHCSVCMCVCVCDGWEV